MAPVDIAKARKAAQRLTDVAFANRDRATGELIRPHFEIPARPDDDDLILSRALDEIEGLRAISLAASAVSSEFADDITERDAPVAFAALERLREALAGRRATGRHFRKVVDRTAKWSTKKQDYSTRRSRWRRPSPT